MSAIGVGETAFTAAGPRRTTTFVTGIVDLWAAPARLLDVVPERTGKAVSDRVSARDQTWREQVTVAALDPFRGYATALRTSLPHATRVLDCFHVTKLGFDAVDQVRRRIQQETIGHRGRRDDPLFRVRRVLRRRADRLTDRSFARLMLLLELGDRDQQIARTWIAAQDLCHVFGARDRTQEHTGCTDG